MKMSPGCLGNPSITVSTARPRSITPPPTTGSPFFCPFFIVGVSMQIVFTGMSRFRAACKACLAWLSSLSKWKASSLRLRSEIPRDFNGVSQMQASSPVVAQYALVTTPVFIPASFIIEIPSTMRG